MTAAEMMAELDDHGFTDESTTAKVRVLQHTVNDIEARLPWPWVRDSITLTFDGSSAAPTNMPSNFRAASRLTLTPGYRVRPVRVEEYEDLVQGDYTGTGGAQVYYFDGSTLKVWPTPGAGATATLRYFKWSNPISSTSVETDFLIPSRFHRLIVYGALWKLYEMEDDPDLASKYEGHYENALQQMRDAMWMQQYDQPEHILVTDPDDYYGDY